MRLNKKFLLITTTLSLLLNSNIAYAASESGDAVKPEPTVEKMKAKIYDYEDNKDYIKNIKTDKDDNKMIFTADTGNKKLNDINRWDNSPNVYNNDLKKNQHYKIVEGLVKDQLDENGNIETNYTVLSNNENITLYTSEFTDYEIEFIKDENGVYTFNNDQFLPIGANNFLFGMTFGFDFTLSDNREGMVFSFAGDDDVWVFIDDELVLDLGGIHSKVQGSIDFNNNTVSRTGQFKNEKNAYGALETKLNNLVIGNGHHTLKMFYLERGANNSRCSIQFKLEDVKPVEEKEEPTTEPEQSPEPTQEPEETAEPTSEPTVAPTTEPTVEPTEVPIVNPTVEPIVVPEEETVDVPTVQPTNTPNFETEGDTIKEETPDVTTYDVDDKDNNKNNSKKAKAKAAKTKECKENKENVVDNNSTGTPQTGDALDTAIMITIVVMIVSFTVSAITLIIMKRKRR